MAPRAPVLCVLVDAFRHDYLDPARAPVLSRLAAEGDVARMRPILGYSDSIRAAIFTGAYPDETGYWMEYCYRPGAAAFSPLDRLGALDRLPGDLFRRGLKFALSQTLVRRLRGRRGYRHLSLRHIPFRALGCFDWTLKGGMTEPGALGTPTLFDELTAGGVKWSYLDSAVSGARGVLKALAELDPDTGFVFVYLHHIDMASHVFGLRSRWFERTLRRTDALVGKTIEAARLCLGDGLQTLVFSDHGMSEVRRIVAYPELWTDPAFPDRFCFALDATMVRLWFEDDDEALRTRVRHAVEAGAPGRFLGKDELRALHLDFRERLYGDEIYLLEPGVAIFPNFHSMLKPKAMHAYHPDDPDQQGIVIAPAGTGLRDPVELVELAPLARRLAGAAR
ncbi:MAG: alkaline phosphatase family protein [Gaiellaceae bacterium]